MRMTFVAKMQGIGLVLVVLLGKVDRIDGVIVIGIGGIGTGESIGIEVGMEVEMVVIGTGGRGMGSERGTATETEIAGTLIAAKAAAEEIETNGEIEIGIGTRNGTEGPLQTTKGKEKEKGPVVVEIEENRMSSMDKDTVIPGGRDIRSRIDHTKVTTLTMIELVRIVKAADPPSPTTTTATPDAITKEEEKEVSRERKLEKRRVWPTTSCDRHQKSEEL